MAEVTLKDVRKVYKSQNEEVLAVKDLSLEIRDGEFMCFLGPSGCGKTSTLRMIVGLEEITNGEIYIGDRIVNDLTPQERNVAMSFETYALYTHLTVKENLLFPLKARGLNKSDQQRRLRKVVDMLEIKDILDRSPSSLSGGQQQRVSLGRALIRQPDVFLLDEPLSHLDVSLRISTRSRIKRLHNQLSTTMIYVTHDQLEAISLADRIAVMNFAELQQVGTREELLDRPKNIFVADFIGEPPINFVNCKLDKNDDKFVLRFKNSHYTIELPEKLEKVIKKEYIEDVILGIRPHDILFREKKGYVGLENGTVEIFEFLGEENHVTVNIGGESITVVTDAKDYFKEGEKVDLYLSQDKIHLFDPETEECLTTRYKNQGLI
ncbi:ABC transporter ATP-binding protein [Halothermothrix orenii]|uniref:ABC transporter related n=1 Tax=Halothermothrix orenii (strain H 168 / OCM 544 / DSM 9562) TaxID=373903 RepID=B8D1L7_HALOH|nr:ABC transporter ATP-binding protein [Halothermothrix orenii]ACL69094.1 ABC transporter related [Halothermothrix orenii H 168]